MCEMMTVVPGIESTVQRVQPFLYKPAPDELQHMLQVKFIFR